MATYDETKVWTVGYRRPTGHTIARLDLSLTWNDAEELSREFQKALPYHCVYIVTNAVWDICNPEHEDCGSFLSHTGKRIPYTDNGEFPEGVKDPRTPEDDRPDELTLIRGDETILIATSNRNVYRDRDTTEHVYGGTALKRDTGRIPRAALRRYITARLEQGWKVG